MGKSIRHDERTLGSNFQCNLLSHVEVIALFSAFFLVHLLMFVHPKKSFPLTLLDQFHQNSVNFPYCILHETHREIFDPLKNMADVTKNRT